MTATPKDFSYEKSFSPDRHDRKAPRAGRSPSPEATLTAKARPTAQATRKGVVLLAVAIFCFTAAVSKHLTQISPTAEVVRARFAGHFLVVVLYLGRRFGPALKTTMPWWHVARSRTQLGATVFIFASLNCIGLVDCGLWRLS